MDAVAAHGRVYPQPGPGVAAEYDAEGSGAGSGPLIGDSAAVPW
jgi:hypothetical protein